MPTEPPPGGAATGPFAATFAAIARGCDRLDRMTRVRPSPALLGAGAGFSTISGAALLETEVGRLALVDQWERTASAFGTAAT